MDARELRIGNLVNYKRIPSSINANSILAIVNGSGKYTPIPLTPEWLEKAGFQNNGQNEFAKPDWSVVLRHRIKTYHVYQAFGVADCFVSNVHELQNLYFALIGEELEFKP